MGPNERSVQSSEPEDVIVLGCQTPAEHPAMLAKPRRRRRARKGRCSAPPLGHDGQAQAQDQDQDQAQGQGSGPSEGPLRRQPGAQEKNRTWEGRPPIGCPDVQGFWGSRLLAALLASAPGLKLDSGLRSRERRISSALSTNITTEHYSICNGTFQLQDVRGAAPAARCRSRQCPRLEVRPELATKGRKNHVSNGSVPPLAWSSRSLKYGNLAWLSLLLVVKFLSRFRLASSGVSARSPLVL
ncbi:hypothetical protein GGTG_12629 [Gaeumannomyces tritici R3-111a-1]|uniref:Uncharacterized protein n=1 Tax=Gaeumannomyces tritici (strain R3-111a-1) TaxID=644352 RepID=J3PGK1_GAET3|nr:hypothetical protein GGTG_12629 [Gaeumannomyces tritici R3-111a-1]EJT69746.1 hypothetical protein GGTG_12629 [Gaeumannomyces tritici R3-111a-1]